MVFRFLSARRGKVAQRRRMLTGPRNFERRLPRRLVHVRALISCYGLPHWLPFDTQPPTVDSLPCGRGDRRTARHRPGPLKPTGFASTLEPNGQLLLPEFVRDAARRRRLENLSRIQEPTLRCLWRRSQDAEVAPGREEGLDFAKILRRIRPILLLKDLRRDEMSLDEVERITI
jgi:hypothetical protein